MNLGDQYLIKTIIGSYILGTYPDKETAFEAFKTWEQDPKYFVVGLYLIRFDPNVIEVVNPKKVEAV
jgi:hypothetical protein